ncbi:MAG: hypothetical protein IJA59_04655, partial [Clostridia bacterium]|nr:hypothetical protein [Clostridia bacterium]
PGDLHALFLARFAAAKPARFCRSKNGGTTAQVHTAAVRGAMLRGFAKQTEKEPEAEGRACSHNRIQTLFQQTAASITQPASNTNAGSLVLS